MARRQVSRRARRRGEVGVAGRLGKERPWDLAERVGPSRAIAAAVDREVRDLATWLQLSLAG